MEIWQIFDKLTFNINWHLLSLVIVLFVTPLYVIFITRKPVHFVAHCVAHLLYYFLSSVLNTLLCTIKFSIIFPCFNRLWAHNSPIIQFNPHVSRIIRTAVTCWSFWYLTHLPSTLNNPPTPSKTIWHYLSICYLQFFQHPTCQICHNFNTSSYISILLVFVIIWNHGQGKA